jgi:hypothetical protein
LVLLNLFKTPFEKGEGNEGKECRFIVCFRIPNYSGRKWGMETSRTHSHEDQSNCYLLERKLSEKFFVSGGYNVGIRYNPKQILQPPNFSFEAIAKARWLGPSEAQIIFEEMVKKGVPQEKIFLEELSTTSKKNAEMLRIFLKRTTFQGIKKNRDNEPFVPSPKGCLSL